MATQTPQEKMFAQYIQTRQILIVDASSSSRAILFKLLQGMGAKNQNITLSNAYNQANEIIKEKKPHIVISEYELDKHSALELFQTQRTLRPQESKECLFVVITGTTSQSAVARAAEEDVDAFLIKPFTAEIVRSTIMKAALLKIKPPDYLVKIEAGKALLKEKKWEEAEKLFQEATTLEKNPSLAFFYLGQTKHLRDIFDQAKGKYSKGLEFNKIHYKCMVGLYEILAAEKAHNEAYDIVKRLSQYFPANPKRLSEVLRLAITTKQYADVEKYYAVFCNIEDRDDTLIRYTCAALVVCGKHYLATKNKTRAIELFQKASTTAAGRNNILKQIILILLDFGLVSDANAYLAKFPPAAQSTPDYLLSKFQILNVENPPSIVIERGRELVSKGIVDENLFGVLIKRTLETKLKSAADDLIAAAVKKYPQQKAFFDKIAQDPSLSFPLSGS